MLTMRLPQIDIKNEFGQLDFCTRQMRHEIKDSGERLRTIRHINELLVRLEDGRISKQLALRWLSRIERSIAAHPESRTGR